MRIGITCYPSQGGSGIVATELGLMLAERGHEIHFISYAQPIRLASYRYRQNLTVHEVATPTYPVFQYPPYSLALASKMVQVIDDVDLEIMHVHYAIPHAIAAWLAKQMTASQRVKIVTTLHGTDITLVGLEEAYYKPTCFALAHSDGITAVSEDLRQQTCARFGVACEAIEVLPNFVDRERFVPMTPAQRDEGRGAWSRRGEFVMMHLSNYRPVKRAKDVMQVFLNVRKEVPTKLVLIGEGPELRDCRAMADEAGARADLILLGRQVAVWELLPLADVYMLTSEQESFGLSALEAMACGVPVVATRVGGVPEVLTDGESGFLCPVADVEAMTERVLTLARDRERAATMAEAARERTRQFDAPAVVDRYERMYERMLAGK